MVDRFRSKYRAGARVRVRAWEEIRRTLDERGAAEALPFMPEMLAFCGKEFRVAASAHKTCDTVHYTGGRRMRNAVHLEGLRCDGSAHGGCQARCLLFWKEEWLAPAGEASGRTAAIGNIEAHEHRSAGQAPGCDHATLLREACDESAPESPTYSCQATRLYEATTALSPWSLRQYLADVSSGNASPRDAMKFLFLASLYNMRRLGFAYRLWSWLYERAHLRLVHSRSPYVSGAIPRGAATPSGSLDLQPGEQVEVRAVGEIVATLNDANRNRGLSFDKEMVRYCGQRFRVADRVRRIVNETTGKMIELPTPAVTLEGAYCTSRYSERRLLCPRRITPYWREIWLKRVTERPAGD